MENDRKKVTNRMAGEFRFVTQTEESQTEKQEEGAPVLLSALVCLFSG